MCQSVAEVLTFIFGFNSGEVVFTCVKDGTWKMRTRCLWRWDVVELLSSLL